MDVTTILKRAAEKCGVTRTRYKERDVPTSVESVTVLPFFGDRRSSLVLSSILLKRIKEELKGSRYFVLISWPGDEGMFQYVDEYWQVDDQAALQKLVSEASGFGNSSAILPLLQRSLNQYFYDVMSEKDLVSYYDNGLTSAFFDSFRHVKVNLPSIPSASSLGADVSRELSRRETRCSSGHRARRFLGGTDPAPPCPSPGSSGLLCWTGSSLKDSTLSSTKIDSPTRCRTTSRTAFALVLWTLSRRCPP